MTPRHENETQRAYVERVLLTERRIRVYDVLYNLAYANGRKCSITRLASIVHTLRHQAGWEIAESHEAGLAVYRLVAAPEGAVPEHARPVQPWQSGWTCPTCGGVPAQEPEALLGGIGRAWCARCDSQRMFRRHAA